ncbi:hypothetical protein, partial [Caballeronia arvi]|uniref:hypothetical protein n=1 Tax=Caballeronia arvi TaxID=1777135 RepID=UPI001F2366F8
FDACQHAQRHRHIPVIDGRHRITLNELGQVGFARWRFDSSTSYRESSVIRSSQINCEAIG